MAKQIFVNLPVSDLAASTAFYTALGFTKTEEWSSDEASSMQWSDTIIVMLLAKPFYSTFLNDRPIADTQASNGVLLAIPFDSKEEVQQFADTAKANGGDFYKTNTGMSDDQMFGYEVIDPDGHQWEPLWMSPDFSPHEA
jgi:uncharacterized protein